MQIRTRVTCALLALLAAAGTVQAETKVFMTKDKDGNPIFSDRNTQGAEAHVIQELPSMPAYKGQPANAAAAPAERTEDKFSYTSLSIVAPANGATMAPGLSGNIEVSGVLSPGLRDGDRIVLLRNGLEVASGRQTAFSLENLERGEHQLQMRVENSSGKAIINSQTISVFVQRTSSLAR